MAGLHVPVNPLSELAGKIGTVAPAQMFKAVPKENEGSSLGVMVTVSVPVVAHKPGVGVKVYVSEFVLSIAERLQVPVIPFVDVVGNAGAVAFSQIVIAVPKLNAGVMFGLTVTANVAIIAHWPAVGVKV